MLHEVTEVIENVTFELPCPDFLVKADHLVHHQDQVVSSEDCPHPVEEPGLERRPRVCQEARPIGKFHFELMVASQAPVIELAIPGGDCPCRRG